MDRCNLARLLLAAVLCVQGARLGSAEPTLPKGVTKEALRAEIMRRQAVLLAHRAEDVVPLLREVAAARPAYKTLAGEYLLAFRQVLEKVFLKDELLTQMATLHEEHEQLRKEAERDGVLLSAQVASEIRSGDATGKIYGIPREAMTFDPAKARAADRYREGQWAIDDAYAQLAKRYEEKYSADFCSRVNKVLDQRYDEIVSCRNEHAGRRKQLGAMFAAGSHDAWLGTNAGAAFASLREPTFRLAVEDLPGMASELPAVQRYRLPARVCAPAAPKLFALKYDGMKLVGMKFLADRQSLQADEQVLLLQKLYPAMKIYDVACKIGECLTVPAKDAFANGNWTASQATVATLAGYAKLLTLDTVVGVYDAADRMVDRAASLVKGENFALDTLRDFTKIGAADAKLIYSAAELASSQPQTAEDAFELLNKIAQIRQEMADSGAAQESLNQKVDKAAEAAMDAVALYTAAKGLKSKWDQIKTSKASWGKEFLEYKKAMAEQSELTTKASTLLADENLVKGNPELAAEAETYLKAQAELDSLAKTQVKAETAFRKATTKVAETADDATGAGTNTGGGLSLDEINALLGETKTSNLKPGTVLRTSLGEEIVTGKRLGKGSIGEVYATSENQAIKLFQRDEGGIGKLEHLNREAQTAKLMADDGVPMAKILKQGVLDDGTPYMIKEQVPKTSILQEVVAEKRCLPDAHQQALLELVAETNGKGYFLGDINPGNVYFETLADGRLKAKFLEVDFSKKVSFGGDSLFQTADDLVTFQVEQMTANDTIASASANKGSLHLKKQTAYLRYVEQVTGGGSAGSLHGLIQDKFLNPYKELAKAKIETGIAAEKIKSVATKLGDDIAKIMDDTAGTTNTRSTLGDAVVKTADDAPTTPTSEFKVADECSKVDADTGKLGLTAEETSALDLTSLIGDFTFEIPTVPGL
jgi:putative intracellular protease/amidase